MVSVVALLLLMFLFENEISIDLHILAYTSNKASNMSQGEILSPLSYTSDAHIHFRASQKLRDVDKLNGFYVKGLLHIVTCVLQKFRNLP